MAGALSAKRRPGDRIGYRLPRHLREVVGRIDGADLRAHSAGPIETLPLQSDLRARVREVADQQGCFAAVRSQPAGESDLSGDSTERPNAHRRLHQPVEGPERLIDLQRHTVLGEDPEDPVSPWKKLQTSTGASWSSSKAAATNAAPGAPAMVA